MRGNHMSVNTDVPFFRILFLNRFRIYGCHFQFPLDFWAPFWALSELKVVLLKDFGKQYLLPCSWSTQLSLSIFLNFNICVLQWVSSLFWGSGFSGCLFVEMLPCYIFSLMTQLSCICSVVMAIPAEMGLYCLVRLFMLWLTFRCLWFQVKESCKKASDSLPTPIVFLCK